MPTLRGHVIAGKYAHSAYSKSFRALNLSENALKLAGVDWLDQMLHETGRF